MITQTSRAQRASTRLARPIDVFGVDVPTCLLAWHASPSPATLRQATAGTLIAASVQAQSLPSNALAWIATSTGSVVGQGVFPGVAGGPLVVRQSLRHAALQLCHASTATSCTPLAEIWAGPLHPTPAASSARDCGRYRLMTDNPALWLAPGAGALVLVSAVRARTGLVCTNPRAGPASPP